MMVKSDILLGFILMARAFYTLYAIALSYFDLLIIIDGSLLTLWAITVSNRSPKIFRKGNKKIVWNYFWAGM